MSIKSILVVDDCEPDQFVFKYAIENLDETIEVLQAYDGQEALEIFSKAAAKPEAIVLDLNMPRMDGFEFLEEFSKQFADETTRIAILTSSAQSKDKERVEGHPSVVNYYVKPLSKEKINEMLTALKG